MSKNLFYTGVHFQEKYVDMFFSSLLVINKI